MNDVIYLENANNLVSDGHDPNDGDKESHRTAQHAHGWVLSRSREYENKDGCCDTSDDSGNQQPYLTLYSI